MFKYHAPLILVFSISLVGCDLASSMFSEVTSRFSGHINEELSKTMQSGENHDAVKEIHLKALLKGYNDLKDMNDPNIAEIEKVFDAILDDNYLDMYEYQKAAKIINKHKIKINNENSNHSSSVKDFKKQIS